MIVSDRRTGGGKRDGVREEKRRKTVWQGAPWDFGHDGNTPSLTVVLVTWDYITHTHKAVGQIL